MCIALAVMSHFLYKTISFTLGQARVICLGLGLYFCWNSYSIYFEWILGGSSMNFSFRVLLDYMSLTFLAAVMCISSSVVWYSQRYIQSDKDANRFVLIVLGFIISMVLLIIRPNILSILLGWDGLGLISYCLVVYYPTKKSRSAGMLTVLRNRVGDVCILLSIALFRLFGDFNFPIWVNLLPFQETGGTIGLLIMLAAITKRAQVPFSAWLPAAIAAPTPVSALVHSSTLVTAGVYLLIRFSEGLELGISPLLLFISTFTMFFSGVVATCEYDLKKIIALSTLSQLGVMIFSISLGLYGLAFFHLITHALFKALLFLCAGICIHQVLGPQDLRFFGSLSVNSPIVASSINLANLSLCGIPFLSGFYSKDIIVEFACQGSWNLFIVFIIFVSLGLTVSYSVRLVYLTFVQYTRTSSVSVICDADKTLVTPVGILSTISILSGSVLAWVIISNPSLIMLPSLLKTIALIIITLSGTSIVGYSFSSVLNSGQRGFSSYFPGSMLFLPLIRGQGPSMPVLTVGEKTLKSLDQGWLEFSIVSIVDNTFNKISSIVVLMQRNGLKSHLYRFIIWLLILTVYVLCFYSLNLKHSTEDARIEQFLKNNH